MLSSWSCALLLSLYHALVSSFCGLFFFACLARRDSQTDSLSSYTYISRSIPRFVWFCGLLTTGRLRFYHSLLLRCFSFFLFLHWYIAGKSFLVTAHFVFLHLAKCSNPSSSSSRHHRLRLFFISKYSVVSSSSGRRDQT